MLRIQSGLPVSSVNATLGNLKARVRTEYDDGLTCPPEVWYTCGDPDSLLQIALLPWQQPCFPRLWILIRANAWRIYGNIRPAELVSFPLLMLVPGRKAFCFQPCGWVNDHLYYTKFSRCVSKRLAFLHRCQFLMKRCALSSVKASILKCPGFHPDPESKITARDFPPNR